MPVRNQNWYDLQAGRRYPMDDRSTGLDDSGVVIRESILVDCHIKFPDTLGDAAFVQAITVSPTLVTVLIGVGNGQNTTTIAAVSRAKPIATNKNYEITPLVPGVAGWLVFGSGVEEPFTGKYSTPEQTVLLSRCARSYHALPVQTIRKINLGTGLSGIVNLEAAEPITVTQKQLTIQNRLVNALEFSLAGTFADNSGNPLQYFLPDCGVRPESGTCPKPPIEKINDITPDCNGNINILTEGMSVYQFENCGGIGIDLDIGLAEACDKPRYKQPRQPADDCISSSSSASSNAPNNCPEFVECGCTPPSPCASADCGLLGPNYVFDCTICECVQLSSSSSSLSSSSSSSNAATVETPITLPVCETFTRNLTDVLTVRSGRFIAKTAPAPETCQD